MSYLSDAPLSPDEEKYLSRIERFYNYSHRTGAPDSLTRLPVPYTSNHYIDDGGDLNRTHVICDYFKIDIRNKPNGILLNTTLYQKICTLIKRRYGYFPVNGSLKCDSVSFVTIPNHECSIYYQPGNNDADSPECNFELVGTFVADSKPRKFTVTCPYTDSMFGDRQLYFNWFGNDRQTGRIIPRVIKSSFHLLVANKNMPFLQAQPYGSIFINGIQDAVGFHVSFIGDYRHSPRTKLAYTRSWRVGQMHASRRHRFHHYVSEGSRGVNYELPSEDVSDDSRDQLLEYYTTP